MEIEQENFVIELMDAAKSHDDFLALVKFGIKTLIEDQGLLIEIIFREAERELKHNPVEGRTISDEGRKIFGELELKIIK